MSMLSSVAEEIIQILLEICQLEGEIKEIKLSDKLSYMELNSISFIQFVVKIEEKYSIDFSDDALNLDKYEVVGDIINYITSMIGDTFISK